MLCKKYKKNQFNYLFSFVDELKIGMSSGEEKVITLLSQMYFLKIIHEEYSTIKSVKSNMLLLVDEIETYLHPEWQRTILSNILKNLNKMFKNHNFQIIFTTHSPIILSDIPKENCIFLKKSSNEVEIINNNLIEQTFGQNVYTLYKNAFFLENGFMGSFSKKYIEELNSYIESKSDQDLYNNLNDCLNMINVIGEVVLRKMLLNKIYNKTSNLMSISKRMEILINKRNEIDKELSILKGEMHD